jgi:hypothetical protein
MVLAGRCCAVTTSGLDSASRLVMLGMHDWEHVKSVHDRKFNGYDGDDNIELNLRSSSRCSSRRIYRTVRYSACRQLRYMYLGNRTPNIIWFISSRYGTARAHKPSKISEALFKMGCTECTFTPCQLPFEHRGIFNATPLQPLIKFEDQGKQSHLRTHNSD